MALEPRRALMRVVLAWAALVTLLTVTLVDIPCFSDGLRYGVWPETCAVRTRLDVTLTANGLAREQDGHIGLFASAMWGAPGGGQRTASVRRGAEVELVLQDREGKEVAPPKLKDAGWSGGLWSASVRLPALPDGDYVLVATVRTADDERTVELPVPLYARALIHVMPDRPIVRPGDDIRVRSVTLRATDRTPVGERPGRWELVDPSGKVLWKEQDRAGALGVADTVLSLDGSAEQGTWKVRWVSGAQTGETPVRVERFELPPFAVELAPSKGWYRPTEVVRFDGVARYRSGAPIGGASVRVRVDSEGEWPVPLAWSEERVVQADASGRFVVDLGPVPEDLVGRVEIAATATVAADGSTVSGRGGAVLSTEGLWVEALTELDGGLVGGFNSRVWLHVRTPDGKRVAEQDLVVRVPQSLSLPDRPGRTDADGVVGLNLDPGKPVTVIVPAMPIRERGRTEPPRPVLKALDALGGDPTDRRDLEVAAARLMGCLPDSIDEEVEVGLRVAASGRVTDAQPSKQDPLGRCVAAALLGLQLDPGGVRTLVTRWTLPEPWRMRVHADVEGGVGDRSIASVVAAQIGPAARSCAPPGPGATIALGRVHWSAQAGDRQLRIDAVEREGASDVLDCVLARLRELRAEAADGAGLGVLSLELLRGAGPPEERVRPPGTREGYELEVEVAGEKGRVVLPVGSVPALRLRAEPAIVDPGGELRVELVRGPSFSGALPKKLQLTQGPGRIAEATFDEATRSAVFKVPADARGLAEVSFGGGRAVVLVRDPRELSVTLAPGAERYKPGEAATVEVLTQSGGAGVVALVGLSGVDEGLGQIAELPGPMALAEDVVNPPTGPSVFAHTPTDLLLGRVRGPEAARAVLMRISALGQADGGEVKVDGRAQDGPDTELELALSFWRARTRLMADVRRWETEAPAGKTLQPADVAERWDAALDALEAAGKPAVDGFGRPLRLVLLPPHLLTELDPRKLVSDATRVAEDVESWTGWVDRRLR
jgi:hypothetical protein